MSMLSTYRARVVLEQVIETLFKTDSLDTPINSRALGEIIADQLAKECEHSEREERRLEGMKRHALYVDPAGPAVEEAAAPLQPEQAEVQADQVAEVQAEVQADQVAETVRQRLVSLSHDEKMQYLTALNPDHLGCFLFKIGDAAAAKVKADMADWLQSKDHTSKRQQRIAQGRQTDV